MLAGLREYAAEHVVLIGKPGSGKSTSLERLLWEEAEKAQQDQNARIPVLVKLRRCTGTIEGLIRDFLVGHQVALEISQIEELLRQGRFLLLLDGLNELPEAFKTEVVNFRDRYRRTTPMIVSTRDLGGGGTLGIEKTLKMLPLTEPQMREFVRGYLPEEGDRLLQQLQGDRLQKFAETPLLLLMLCDVFDHNGKVPANLGMTFREFAQFHDQELQEDAPVDSQDQWHRLLRHLAFEMMQGETPTEFRLSMSREELENCLTVYLQQMGRLNPRDFAERWLKDLLKYHLIQPVIQPNLEEHIEFRHQLIQEYYAAEYLLRLLPNLTKEQLKQDYLNYLKWTEPIALMLALEDKEVQALQVVQLAMDEVDLLLGARLAGEVKPIFQATTVGWIEAKTLPVRLKVQYWEVSHSERAVDSLLVALQDSDDDVRTGAAVALGKIGGEKAVDSLLVALQDSDDNVRKGAARALGKIGGEKAIDGLLGALQDSDSLVCSRVAEALEEIGGERAADGLLCALKDSDDLVRVFAAMALGKIGSERAVDGLLGALKDSLPGVSGSAARALGEIGEEKAVDGLLYALKDSDSGVYMSIAAALGEIGGEKAINGLLDALQDSDYSVCSSAAAALGKLGGEKALDVLLDALQDSDDDVRRGAAWALGEIGGEKAVDGLLGALQDSNDDVRRIAVEALGEIGGEKAIDGLLGTLKDSSDRARSIAAAALGKLGGEKAVDGLLGTLQDSDDLVRLFSAGALGKIGSEKAIDVLLDDLKDSDKFVCRIATDELGEIGGAKAINGLLGALQDSDDYVRKGAAEALGKIGNAQLLADLWHLSHQQGKSYLWDAIAAIQNRCQFYNYEIWQKAMQRSQLEKQDEGRKLMAEQPSISITGGTFNAPVNLASNYGNQPTTIIGTQHNYFGGDESLNQEIADLQQFIATLESEHPDLKTEQEADQVVTTALTAVQTQKPDFWQKLRHQMGVLKQQVFNPERHKQAAKATVVEIAKTSWEKSLIAKAIITYLDKLSETPDQGN